MPRRLYSVGIVAYSEEIIVVALEKVKGRGRGRGRGESERG